VLDLLDAYGLPAACPPGDTGLVELYWGHAAACADSAAFAVTYSALPDKLPSRCCTWDICNTLTQPTASVVSVGGDRCTVGMDVCCVRSMGPTDTGVRRVPTWMEATTLETPCFVSGPRRLLRQRAPTLASSVGPDSLRIALRPLLKSLFVPLQAVMCSGR